ncbi:cation diffusion facilitator family transporter [Candidatus Saccharibacteria bacterium]|nr:cation diffusion facilitator family transporter [Candidatus Saccharibacteria bacterium]
MEKTRSKVIVKSGYLFILTNFLLAIFNVIVGLISGSLAIISDALHSLIDAISGALIIASEKIASHKKFLDRREKIERTTTILIALIIIAVGVHIIIESIEKIIEPSEVDYNLPTMIVLISSIIAKYALAFYLKKSGKTYKSNVLIASSAETMNDTIISIAVFLSAIIYLIVKVDIEAYVSLAISVIIIKVGLEFIFPHLSRHHHHPLESNPDHDHCGKSSPKSSPKSPS